MDTGVRKMPLPERKLNQASHGLQDERRIAAVPCNVPVYVGAGHAGQRARETRVKLKHPEGVHRVSLLVAVSVAIGWQWAKGGLSVGVGGTVFCYQFRRIVVECSPFIGLQVVPNDLRQAAWRLGRVEGREVQGGPGISLYVIQGDVQGAARRIAA